MKVILYMAMTVNGYIARENDETPWSDIEWESFTEMIKKVGNYVMGRRTYETSLKAGVFPYPCLSIVMTKEPIENKWGDQVIFTDKSPQDVLKLLGEKGFDTAFVGGGGQINASFMKENLVDEIYLDIEPLVFGKGIKLFADADFEAKLELIGTQQLSENEIQLHYRVKK